MCRWVEQVHSLQSLLPLISAQVPHVRVKHCNYIVFYLSGKFLRLLAILLRRKVFSRSFFVLSQQRVFVVDGED